jgi:predicted nuclease of predicted toxin-antitoxin system
MSDDLTSSSRSRYVFLLDENIGRDIREFLIGAGYSAVESRDVIGVSAPDEEIEETSAVREMIIVTHDRDFRTHIRRAIPRKRRNAPVLWLHVREPRALQRLQQCQALIEFHLAYAQALGYGAELINLSENRAEIVYHVPRL